MSPYAQELEQDIHRIKERNDAGELAKMAMMLSRELAVREISEGEHRKLVELLNAKPVSV